MLLCPATENSFSPSFIESILIDRAGLQRQQYAKDCKTVAKEIQSDILLVPRDWIQVDYINRTVKLLKNNLETQYNSCQNSNRVLHEHRTIWKVSVELQ